MLNIMLLYDSYSHQQSIVGYMIDIVHMHFVPNALGVLWKSCRAAEAFENTKFQASICQANIKADFSFVKSAVFVGLT